VQVVEEVRRHFGDRVFRSLVPRSVRLSEAPSFGQTIFQYAPGSLAALAYRNLCEETAERWPWETPVKTPAVAGPPADSPAPTGPLPGQA